MRVSISADNPLHQKMRSEEVDKAKQRGHEWLDQLSNEQAIAVVPILLELSGLITVCSGKNQRESTLATNVEIDTSVFLEPSLKIENQLERILEIRDPQALREAIATCLDLFRSEKTHLNASRSKANATNLLKSPTVPTTDATTGLPGRLLFERIVANAVAESKESITALFVVERLAYINKRFGRITGDEILLSVAQYLAQELPDSSSLSRWSGPAFAAILHPTAGKKTEMQVRAISRRQLSKTMETGGRSVMLPINCSCMIEPLSEGSSPDLIFSKMDDFISAHLSD